MKSGEFRAACCHCGHLCGSGDGADNGAYCRNIGNVAAKRDRVLAICAGRLRTAEVTGSVRSESKHSGSGSNRWTHLKSVFKTPSSFWQNTKFLLEYVLSASGATRSRPDAPSNAQAL